MKICSTCQIDKPLTEFYNSSLYKDGKSYRCKGCDAIARKAYRDKNLDSERVSKKKAQIKFKYGLDWDQYQQMLADQDGCCWICQKRSELVIDHCHATNVVRGLLCKPCNQALGLFYDDVESLERAINYLKFTKENIYNGS